MIRTWHAELAFVALVLGSVVVVAGPSWLEALGAAAVLFAFAHAQVAERMAEREAARARPDVGCHRWAGRYFTIKEVLWLAYFLAHQTWSALAGVVVFLAYPLWRRWWRARRPLQVAR